MKKFLIRFTLFALPFTIYFAVIGSLAYYTGEALPFSTVLRMQAVNPDLRYFPYDQEAIFAYKATYLQSYAPEIVILGSSRVLQYRTSFFNRNPEAVYNAGGHTWNLRHMLSMTQYFDAESMPKIVILSLEQPDFRAQDSFVYQPLTINVANLDANRRVLGLANITRALFGNRYFLSRMTNAENYLGLEAINSRYGFRYDGSFQISDLVLGSVDDRHARHLELFENRETSYFSPATAISTHNLTHLENLIEWASENDIYLLAYYPPFSPTIYEGMMSSGEYTYISDSVQALTELFESHGLHFFDFSNPEWLGATNAAMYDGIHSGERLYLKMHIEMMRALPDVFADYVDLEFLETWLAQSDDPFSVSDAMPVSD